jgi:hypothetical protein
MVSPVCLPVCVFPLATSEPIRRLSSDSDGGHATEGEIDYIIFNATASRILEWWRFIFLWWMQNVHQSALGYQG